MALQELANSVWGFARLCFLHEDFMDRIADRLLTLRRGLFLGRLVTEGAFDEARSSEPGAFTVQERDLLSC